MYPSEGDERYKPRAKEEHLYAACLLTLGAGPKDYSHTKSHRQQVQDGMNYGVRVDKWWLDNCCSAMHGINERVQSYCFRRRFLKWCREK